MTDPQVYVLESSDEGPFYPPPSVERQKEVLALWRRFCTSDPEHLSIFWWFIRAIDAQHAERSRAEVEKMREAATRVIERLRAVPIDDDYESATAALIPRPRDERERCIRELYLESNLWGTSKDALEALAGAIERLRALPIEGTGQ